MAKQKKRVGGRKEAPLAIVGSSGATQEQQEKVLTPKDAEYQHYIDLLRGYFEKLTRWQKVLTDEKYRFIDKPGYWENRLDVLQTEQGLIMSTVKGDPGNDKKPDRVLNIEVTCWNEPLDEDGNYETMMIYMDFKPGIAGEQLLVDPDGEPLKEVQVHVNSYLSGRVRELNVAASYPYKPYPQVREPERDIEYKLQEGRLEVSKWFPYLRNSTVMPDTYATHLFNTLDALIPGTPTQQTGRRVTPELPAPRRRRTPR